MPLKAVSTSDVDKKDLQTRWYLNMPNKEFRDPLPSMDPKEKEGKRQEIFDKFKSTTITVQSPATKKTVGVDVLVPKIVLENKIPGGRLSPKIHVRFHGGGFVSLPQRHAIVSPLTCHLLVYRSAVISKLVSILCPRPVFR